MKFSRIYVIIIILLFVGILFQWVHGRLYLIPSDSMQELLQAGDVVWLHKSKEVKRNDVIIFSFPEGDTMYRNRPDINYYDILRLCGRSKSLQDTAKFGELIYVPLQYRQTLVKRCLGLPGDTLQMINWNIIINNFWILNPDSAVQFSNTPVNMDCGINFTQAEFYRWKHQTETSVIIPQNGITVKLTPCNLPFYHRIISVYEKNTLEIVGNKIFINKEEKKDYTFQQNYYFMAGDNRSDSKDSRVWGFVPEDHIMGKAAMIIFAFKNDDMGKNEINWDRIFKLI